MTSRENYNTSWSYSNSWIEQLRAKQYMQGDNARTRITKEESHLLSTHTINLGDKIIQIKQNLMKNDDTVSFHDPFLEFMANVYQPVTYVDSVSSPSQKSKRDQEDEIIYSMLNYHIEHPIPRNATHKYHLSHKYHIFKKNARSKVQWMMKVVVYDEFGNMIESRTADRVGKFSLEDLEWIVMRDLGGESNVLSNLQKEHNVAREMFDFKI